MKIKLTVFFVPLFFTQLFQVAIASHFNVHNQNTKITNPVFSADFGWMSTPIYQNKGLLYAKGELNGKQALFIIDTGKNRMGLLADGLKKLKLQPIESKTKMVNMTGQLNQTNKVILDSINVGNTELTNIHADIIHEPFKNDVPTVVLGNTFLKTYHGVVDLSHNKLYLRKKRISKKSKHAIERNLVAQGYRRIPLTVLRSSGPYGLAIKVNTLPAALFLIFP